MLQEIVQELRTNSQLSPDTLSDYLVKLGGEYERIEDIYTDIKIKKPFDWIKIRKEASSVKEADMTYAMTEDGQNEIKLMGKLKAIEKIMSSIRARLRIKEQMARNIM